MPTKPVAPVSRSAPSGTGGVKGWDKGIGTPAVECERPACRAAAPGAMAGGPTFTTANPTSGPGDTMTLLAGHCGPQTRLVRRWRPREEGLVGYAAQIPLSTI